MDGAGCGDMARDGDTDWPDASYTKNTHHNKISSFVEKPFIK